MTDALAIPRAMSREEIFSELARMRAQNPFVEGSEGSELYLEATRNTPAYHQFIAIVRADMRDALAGRG